MTSSDKRIFVAGATGAVGRRLCRLLVEDGWTVAGTSRSREKVGLLRDMGVEPVVVDVYDGELLRNAMMDFAPSVVMHQLTDLPYGLDPALMVNARVRNARLRVIGTANLVAAAKSAHIDLMVAQSIGFAYKPGEWPSREHDPLAVDDADMGMTARAVLSMEHQVRRSSFEGIVLRYGRLYGPGTGFDAPASACPLHVDAAADAARRAVRDAIPGIYNVAEDDGTIDSSKIRTVMNWSDAFRMPERAASESKS